MRTFPDLEARSGLALERREEVWLLASRADRASKLHATRVRNPAIDTRIPHRYTPDDLSGKARMKAALLKRMELPATERAPVLGIVSRLTAQKGFDLLHDSLAVFLQREDLRIVVQGSGEERYEKYFEWLANAFPQKVAYRKACDEDLAHWIEAGSDKFLMPSRFEPCGLNQMFSLKYGTAPIVRRTGGLADTVSDWSPRTGEGTASCSTPSTRTRWRSRSRARSGRSATARNGDARSRTGWGRTTRGSGRSSSTWSCTRSCRRCDGRSPHSERPSGSPVRRPGAQTELRG